MAIFVFGSNTAGRHGAGAAKYALQNEGAIFWQGIGLQGNSYAIPTKDDFLNTLSLEDINTFVAGFLAFAWCNPELTFNVTRIGCGLAGYRDQDIAPMFKQEAPNCKFPTEWKPWLGDLVSYHDLH